MNVMALLAHQEPDIEPIDKASDCKPVLQLAATIGADGEVGVHHATLIKGKWLVQPNPKSLVPGATRHTAAAT
jgi:hypothetical protein